MVKVSEEIDKSLLVKNIEDIWNIEKISITQVNLFYRSELEKRIDIWNTLQQFGRIDIGVVVSKTYINESVILGVLNNLDIFIKECSVIKTDEIDFLSHYFGSHYQIVTDKNSNVALRFIYPNQHNSVKEITICKTPIGVLFDE